MNTNNSKSTPWLYPLAFALSAVLCWIISSIYGPKSPSKPAIDPAVTVPSIEVVYSDPAKSPSYDNGRLSFSVEKNSYSDRILIFVSPETATRSSANLKVKFGSKELLGFCTADERAVRPTATWCASITYHDLTERSAAYTISATNTAGSAEVPIFARYEAPAKPVTPTEPTTPAPQPTTPVRPTIESQSTPSGVSYDQALSLCEKRLENTYGYELSSVDLAEIRGDTWYFELEGLYETSYYWSINVAYCTVGGSASGAHILSFREDEYDRGHYSDDGDYESDAW